MVRTIKTVVFVGSGRNVVPPWGGVKRLGDQVLPWVLAELKKRARVLGGETLKHEVTVVDPVEVFGAGGALEFSGAHLQAPLHFLDKAKVPAKADALSKTITAADCYIVVSAEYNHTIPPALTGLLGHFGGSHWALKPSAIVTYSVGPFGGQRCAMALRPFLSELGCLPISKVVGLPMAQDMFTEKGEPKDPNNRMLGQLPAQLNELEWMAVAMSDMRNKHANPQA